MEKLINRAKQHLAKYPNNAELIASDLSELIEACEKLEFGKLQSWTIKYKECRRLKIESYFVKDAPNEITAKMNAISTLPRNIKIITVNRE